MLTEKRFTIKSILINYMLTLSIIFFLINYFYASNSLGKSTIVIFSFLINILFAAKKLLWDDKYPFSFFTIFWFTTLFFLCLAPFFQYGVRWNALKYMPVNDVSILELNSYVFLYMLTYSLTYKFFSQKDHNFLVIELRKPRRKDVLRIFFFLVVILLLNIHFHGISNLFFRSLRSVQSDIAGVNILGLFLEILLFSTSFLIVMNLEALLPMPNFQKSLYIVCTLLIFLILFFPTSKARFFIGTVYLGLFLSLKKNFRNEKGLIIVLFLGFLFALPILSATRRAANFEELFSPKTLKLGYDFFIGGDFSTYSMGLSALEYVKNEGFFLGKQMFSNIFYFIPRRFWSGKEYSLGYTIAEYYGHHFYNMDSPLVMEFFVDFGIIGLIIFTFILAMLCERGDSFYWITRQNRKKHLFNYMYPFLVIIFIFVNRGALMSTFSRMMNIVIGFFLISPLFIQRTCVIALKRKKDRTSVA